MAVSITDFLAQVIAAVFFYQLSSPDWCNLFKTGPIPPLKKTITIKHTKEKNNTTWLGLYMHLASIMCCPSQGAVPLQPKQIQAVSAAAPPLPPSPAAHSQPFPGTTDCADTLSSWPHADLGNRFTEIQPHQIREVLSSCTASLKELAEQLEK